MMDTLAYYPIFYPYGGVVLCEFHGKANGFRVFSKPEWLRSAECQECKEAQ